MRDQSCGDYDYDCGQAPDTGTTRSVTYALDKAGNRTSVVDTGVSTTYTPNNLNQYTGVGGTNNVTNGSEHEIASYQSTDYTYINDEHLISVTSGNRVYTLGYDALGRCVKRTIRGVTNYYVYDGEKSVLEYNSTGTSTHWATTPWAAAKQISPANISTLRR